MILDALQQTAIDLALALGGILALSLVFLCAILLASRSRRFAGTPGRPAEASSQTRPGRPCAIAPRELAELEARLPRVRCALARLVVVRKAARR